MKARYPSLVGGPEDVRGHLLLEFNRRFRVCGHLWPLLGGPGDVRSYPALRFNLQRDVRGREPGGDVVGAMSERFSRLRWGMSQRPFIRRRVTTPPQQE